MVAYLYQDAPKLLQRSVQEDGFHNVGSLKPSGKFYKVRNQGFDPGYSYMKGKTDGDML